MYGADALLDRMTAAQSQRPNCSAPVADDAILARALTHLTHRAQPVADEPVLWGVRVRTSRDWCGSETTRRRATTDCRTWRRQSGTTSSSSPRPRYRCWNALSLDAGNDTSR